MFTSNIEPADEPAKYLDDRECAARYKCSTRHWHRLVTNGQAPQPTRFGRLVRWSVKSLENWEDDGCPKLD